VPGYFLARQGEPAMLARLLENADFHGIQTVGHNLKGTGASYGFTELSTIGAQIERAAKAIAREAVAEQLANLSDYLSRIDLVTN
jgi:HPt (histidine-containing phosphotransfer) domain-containing protein